MDAFNIGTVGLNAGNIEAYRTALKGLSVEQSVFALASKGATEEQIRQILVTNQAMSADVEAALAKAGLTTATNALTQAEMVEIATKNGVAKAEAESLLSKIGITATEEGQVAVKKQVTLAMLEQAVASGTLTKAESAQIATMLGLNAVETTNIGITNVLTASFAKLWAVITAHPIGAILTAIGAVAVGTIAYINRVNKKAKEAIVEAHETAEQVLEDTKTSLSNDKSELQSINSELETTKERLKEISSIGAPTLTEQNGLNKLSLANTQLETQKTLLENNIKLKQKSAALNAKSLLGTQVEMEYSNILDGTSIESHIESYNYKEHAKYQASSLRNAYDHYMDALRSGNVRKQKLAQELINTSAGDAAVFTSELLDIIESFKYDDGTIIEGYEDLYNEYMGMIYNLQSLTNPDTFLEIAKSVTSGTGVDYEKDISEAYKLAYEGNFDIASLNQEFVNALSDAGIDESTIDYIFKLRQQEYQLLIDKINSKYDVSKVNITYWDENGNIHHYYDEEKSVKNQVERINQTLNNYASKNPIEFQLVTSYDEDFELLDQYIEEEKLKAENNTNYIGDYIVNAINRIYDEAKMQSEDFADEITVSSSISQLIDQLNTRLKPVFDSLKSAYQSIFTDDGFSPDSVDISMLESIKSDIEELNNLEDVDINIDMDDFDDFAKILTDVNTTEQQAQQAFDDLATAIFNATGATEGMTDESVSLVEQLLESLGVVNATEVAVQALNEAKVQAVMAAYDLIDATESEYIAMLNEAEAAGITRQEVYKLMAAEIAFGNNGLSVEQKIAQLKELANAYGDTATSALATAIMNEYASGHTDADTAINNVMEQINAGLQKVDIKFSGAIKSAGSGAKSAAGSAGKEAGEAYTDALEKELNALDTRMEAGYIDFNDYIQARLDLINDYYRQGKIAADEYYSHLEKHYEKQLSGYNKVLNAVTRRYDKEIDSINEIIDGIKKQNDALEKQLDEYDSALKVVDRVYEDQIKALKEQQDAIDDQINALKSANDERQRAIELDKAKYELERAQSQRTKLVYSDEKGMHYETDSDAIRSAREAVENAQLEDVIAQLEKEKDAIDPLIEELENYREKWAEISNAYQDAIDKNIAESILGPDYKELILQNRIEDIEAFKDRYVAAQKQIDDNQGLIDSYNEKIEYYEALKQQWQDIADAYENSIEDQYAAMILGQNWEADVLSGRIDTLNAFKNEYAAIQQAIVDYAWYSANEQIKAAEAAKSAAGTPSSTPSISSGSNTASLPSGTAGTVKKGSTGASIHIGGGSTANTQFVNRYASGTNNAKKGLNLVGEDGAEVYFDNHGHVAIVTAPTLIPMEGGEVVKNEKETKKLLNPDNLAPVVNDEMITLANGTALRPLQPGDKMYDYIQKFNAYVEKMGGDINAIAAPFGTIQKNTKQMANSLNTVSHISNNRTQGVNIGDINITCPGITSREVAKQVGVEVSNLFHGLHLTAMQESMKR